MKWWIGLALVLGANALLGCSSDSDSPGATTDPSPTSSSSGGAGGGGEGGAKPTCDELVAETIGAVDAVSTGDVAVRATDGDVRHVFIDASAGGAVDQMKNPWTYISLKDAARVDVTDPESLKSTEWDVAFKQSVIRSNSGDGGPGDGGAKLVSQTFDDITSADGVVPAKEKYVDASCDLIADQTGGAATAFADWYDYNPAAHTLAPHPGAFVVRGGDGATYKLAILDWYANADGTSGGNDGGFYEIEIAPLP